MNQIKILFSTLLITLLFHSSAVAQSPWLWEMTLQEANVGNMMNKPTAIHIDPDEERYYVVDSGNNRLLSYNRIGEFLSGFTAGNQLQGPFDMVREKGVLWVVEKGRNSITKIDLQKKKIIPKQLKYKNAPIYADRLEKSGNIFYLLDKASGSIFALNDKLEILNRFACDKCSKGFVDFKIINNEIFALEQHDKAVFVFSIAGDLQRTVQLEKSNLDFPRALAVDESGYIYILDRHLGEIVVFSSEGEFKYSFLSAGQARGQLYYPIEIRFDPWGQLCVVEEGNGRVQIFTHR